MEKGRKIQFTFSQKTIEIIDWLKKVTDAASLAEVIRNALYVYHWLAKFIINGGEVFCVDVEGKPVKLIFPNIQKQGGE